MPSRHCLGLPKPTARLQPTWGSCNASGPQGPPPGPEGAGPCTSGPAFPPLCPGSFPDRSVTSLRTLTHPGSNSYFTDPRVQAREQALSERLGGICHLEALTNARTSLGGPIPWTPVASCTSKGGSDPLLSASAATWLVPEPRPIAENACLVSLWPYCP